MEQTTYHISLRKHFHEFWQIQFLSSPYVHDQGVLGRSLIQVSTYTRFEPVHWFHLPITDIFHHTCITTLKPYYLPQIAKFPGQLYSIRVHLYFAFLCPLGLLLTTSFNIFGAKISGPSTCHIASMTARLCFLACPHPYLPWVVSMEMHIYIYVYIILLSYQLQHNTSFQLLFGQ